MSPLTKYNTPIENTTLVKVDVTPHDYRTSADFKLVNELLNRPRYRIPEALRDKVISAIERVIDSPQSTINTTIQAIRTLAMLDKCNIEITKMVMPKRVEHESVKSLTDEQLLDAVKQTIKLLPPEFISEQ